MFITMWLSAYILQFSLSSRATCQTRPERGELSCFLPFSGGLNVRIMYTLGRNLGNQNGARYTSLYRMNGLNVVRNFPVTTR